MLDSEILETPLFEGPGITTNDDAMDKIVGKLDVCMWKPSNSLDAMDWIISETENLCVNVETKCKDKLDVALNVETKRCSVRLVRLDSILFGDSLDNNAGESEDVNANSQKILETPPTLPRLSSRNRSSRVTRRPRTASQNKQYTEEPEPPPPVKTQSKYVKNIKPLVSGPSEECINAQTKKSEQPLLSLPGLPVPEVGPYDVETEVESDKSVDTPDKTVDIASPKKGTISIMSHTLKKKVKPRKYKCKICSIVLGSAHELTTHHQTNHNILYCST